MQANKGRSPQTQAGETLLWQGRAAPGTPPDLSNPGKLIFGFAFVAFALFWMDKAMAKGPIWLAGLPFLAFGLRLSVWQAWAPRLRAKCAHYSLTDRRALVETRWPVIGTRTESLILTPATIVDADTAPDGTTTLTLRQQVTGPRGSTTQSLTFARVERAADLLALIAQVQRSAA